MSVHSEGLLSSSHTLEDQVIYTRSVPVISIFLFLSLSPKADLRATIMWRNTAQGIS